MSTALIKADLREQSNRLILQAYARGLNVQETAEATGIERRFIAPLFARLTDEAVAEAHRNRKRFIAKQMKLKGNHEDPRSSPPPVQ